MKKIFVLIIALILAICSAACSKNESPGGGSLISLPGYSPKWETLDKTIEEALDSKQNEYLSGEFFSSAYHILQTDEENEEITLYLLVTHGMYNRDTGLEMVSGCGVEYGVLRLIKDNDLYMVMEYNEYDFKSLLGSPEMFFSIEAWEDAQANMDKYYAKMQESKEKKVKEYFELK